MNYLTNINFTDSQGVTHAAATFGVSFANRFANVSESIERNVPDYDQLVTNINEENRVNVQFYYFVSEQARIDKKDPYILTNRIYADNGDLQHVKMTFDFDATGAEYANKTLNEQCLYFLENVVLPTF